MATVVGPDGERRYQGYQEVRPDWEGSTLRAEGMRFSWGGIFGGVLTAMGLMMLLTALGLAIGITAVDPTETEASSVGIGAGIWASLSLLVSLFLGGMIATRAGAITDRTTGFFEGALVWVVSLLLMAYFASSGVSTLASGAFRLVGGATQAIGTVAATQGGGAGMDFSGTAEQIAARLRAPQTAQQVANVTGLEQSQVRDVLTQTAQSVEANRDNPAQAAEEARRGVAQLMDRARSSGALAQRAEQVQPEAASAAWITFFALLLSLAAAVAGAMLGRRKAAEAVVTPALQ